MGFACSWLQGCPGRALLRSRSAFGTPKRTACGHGVQYWAWGGVTCQRQATGNLELAASESPGKIPLLPWKGVSTLSLEVCKGVPWL